MSDSVLPENPRQRAILVRDTIEKMVGGRMDSTGAKSVVVNLLLSIDDWISHAHYTVSVDHLREIIVEIYLMNKAKK